VETEELKEMRHVMTTMQKMVMDAHPNAKNK
jgi:hypothetical protein